MNSLNSLNKLYNGALYNFFFTTGEGQSQGGSRFHLSYKGGFQSRKKVRRIPHQGLVSVSVYVSVKKYNLIFLSFWHNSKQLWKKCISGQIVPFYTHFSHLKKNGKSTFFYPPSPKYIFSHTFLFYFEYLPNTKINFRNEKISTALPLLKILFSLTQPFLYYYCKVRGKRLLRVGFIQLFSAT